MVLRQLREVGIGEFERYLDSGAPGDIPRHLLTEGELSEVFAVEAVVEPRSFASKLEAAEYLSGVLKEAPAASVDGNVGLWTWLAVFYFDELCPTRASGSRKVLETAKYVLQRDWRLQRRHLLATPYKIFRMYRDTQHQASILLSAPISEFGEMIEQLTARQELITNKGLIDTVHMLYCDAVTGGAKRGATSHGAPGSIRRLIRVLQQLDVTHDLYGLDAEQTLGLLPREFDRWRKRRAT
jgi:hypothetical protein